MIGKEINYDIAVPDKKRSIILWLLTFGRMGNVILRKPAKCIEWTSVQSQINCRSAPFSSSEGELPEESSVKGKK